MGFRNASAIGGGLIFSGFAVIGLAIGRAFAGGAGFRR